MFLHDPHLRSPGLSDLSALELSGHRSFIRNHTIYESFTKLTWLAVFGGGLNPRLGLSSDYGIGHSRIEIVYWEKEEFVYGMSWCLLLIMMIDRTECLGSS